MPLSLKKEYEYGMVDWTARNKEFSEDNIRVSNKDGLPTSIQDKIQYTYK